PSRTIVTQRRPCPILCMPTSWSSGDASRRNINTPARRGIRVGDVRVSLTPATPSRILDRVPIVIGIAVAGAIGAVARYGVDELIGRGTGGFPWGIFVVNVSGAFLIGFMVEFLEPRFEASWVRAAVVTGFLGAYTTFSTLSLDTYRLLEEGHTGQ